MTSVSARESLEKDETGEPGPFEPMDAMLWRVLLRSRLLVQPVEKIELPKGEVDGGM